MREANRILGFREAERVEIVSLMDNTIDLLSTSPREEVKGFRDWVKGASRYPIAEHGFSMLIRIFGGNKTHSLLFDAGGSPRGVIINSRRMGISLAEVECIVLSHGHHDHFGGLPAVAKTINKSGLPIIVHSDMFRKRGTLSSSGIINKYPVFPKRIK
ncbi:MAG: MBL fold metallo-hydrolase [Candidatus Bathyarchaeia archaeon]